MLAMLRLHVPCNPNPLMPPPRPGTRLLAHDGSAPVGAMMIIPLLFLWHFVRAVVGETLQPRYPNGASYSRRAAFATDTQPPPQPPANL